jgi:hypothetical protein
LDGNGITGHDETSENFVESWSIIGNEKEISFQDIITNLDNQESQEVFGILTFPDNYLENKKY